MWSLGLQGFPFRQANISLYKKQLMIAIKIYKWQPCRVRYPFPLTWLKRWIEKGKYSNHYYCWVIMIENQECVFFCDWDGRVVSFSECLKVKGVEGRISFGRIISIHKICKQTKAINEVTREMSDCSKTKITLSFRLLNLLNDIFLKSSLILISLSIFFNISNITNSIETTVLYF